MPTDSGVALKPVKEFEVFVSSSGELASNPNNDATDMLNPNGKVRGNDDGVRKGKVVPVTEPSTIPSAIHSDRGKSWPILFRKSYNKSVKNYPSLTN